MATARDVVTVVVCALFYAGCGVEPEDEAALGEETIGRAEMPEVLACPVGPLSSVSYERELVIRSTDVVDDQCRTSWNPLCSTTIRGKWTFGYLIQQIAGATDPSTFVLKWLESFEASPLVNGQPLAQRTGIRSKVITPWRQASGCSFVGNPLVDSSPCLLDFTKAPFRLLAIVNRMDLRADGGDFEYGGGSAGEGRFIFGFTDPNGAPLDATVILEYELPTHDWGVHQWASAWHGLGHVTAPSPQYNDALQGITERFVKAGASLSGLNGGSAVRRVRTNERAFDPGNMPELELREHSLQCRPGQACAVNARLLLPTVVAQTPRNDLNVTHTLRMYLDDNGGPILDGAHQVPPSMLGAASRPFSNPPGAWMGDAPLADLATEADVRRLFGFSTCNGCHSVETGTSSFHVAPRAPLTQAPVSGFLSGAITVADPLGGQLEYDEASRRKCELLWLLAGNGSTFTTSAGRAH